MTWIRLTARLAEGKEHPVVMRFGVGGIIGFTPKEDGDGTMLFGADGIKREVAESAMLISYLVSHETFIHCGSDEEQYQEYVAEVKKILKDGGIYESDYFYLYFGYFKQPHIKSFYERAQKERILTVGLVGGKPFIARGKKFHG